MYCHKSGEQVHFFCKFYFIDILLFEQIFFNIFNDNKVNLNLVKQADLRK